MERNSACSYRSGSSSESQDLSYLCHDIANEVTVPVTPEPNFGTAMSVFNEERFGTAFSSGGGSSGISSKESSASISSLKSSSSSSDFELDSDSYIHKHLVQKLNADYDGKKEDLMSAEEDDVVLQTKKDALYQDLLEKVADYEKQLKAAHEKILTSQEEVSRLDHKMKLEIDEVTNTMQNRLHSADDYAKAVEAELASERQLVFKLQEKLSKCESDLSVRDRKVEELNLAVDEARKSFCSEKSQFLAEISLLSDKQNCTVKKLEEEELKVKDQIRVREAEKIRARESLEAQEKLYRAEIGRLKTEIYEKCKEVETLNKDFDAKKFAYDMLMAEKNEQSARAQSLAAQLSSQSKLIKQLERRISQLEGESAELVVGLENREMIENELRARVEELENEMDQQRAVISDRAEEKREAIRQLCFSLEYYRTEYHELCRAFKRQPVVSA